MPNRFTLNRFTPRRLLRSRARSHWHVALRHTDALSGSPHAGSLQDDRLIIGRLLSALGLSTSYETNDLRIEAVAQIGRLAA
jgi:hypothetical protein